MAILFQETDDDTDSGLENSQDAYEGNKDAARASLRVKQKLDGYEDGEMRSVQGQVIMLCREKLLIQKPYLDIRSQNLWVWCDVQYF